MKHEEKKVPKSLKTLESLKNLSKLRDSPSFKAASIVVVVLFLIFFIVTQMLTIVQLRYEIADLEEEKASYKNQAKLLTERIQKTKTNQYIEKEARERLGMVKSTEIPIKVYEKEVKTIKEATLEPTDKINIYLKDWYSNLKEKIRSSKSN